MHVCVCVYVWCVCVYAVCMCCVVCSIEHLWKSEDKLSHSVLSFHHVGTGDQTQVSRLGSKHLCSMDYFIVQWLHFHNIKSVN